MRASQGLQVRWASNLDSENLVMLSFKPTQNVFTKSVGLFVAVDP